MKISTLFYTLRQGIKGIFRNKLFSLASIATISACLFLFGILYAIVMNFQHIVRAAEEGFCVVVFFDEGIEDTRKSEIGDLIRLRTEVSEVKYVSSAEAWDWYKEKHLQGHADGFPTNPLENYDNYEVYLNDVSMYDSLVTYLMSVEGVRYVRRSDVVAEALSGGNMLIAYVSLGIIGILLAVSIFLISNTVTIGISVRQEEINIMKYIGATDFFVRAPFVIEGMLIGAIGAGIPLGLIYLLYNKIVVQLGTAFPALSELLRFLSVKEIFDVLTPVSLGIGIGIGFLGSFTTVRKHLRV
ncbi:MAG: permease-like cell division protein FtsX [Lachnospiraceae bacterium]|nr:permease-like cell division protein FtsX [Lachnospiraceae bacterium]MDE6129584.1 permease-like cell division protein FtsX [Lachnospiraceae bacterium]